jgi:hypothetical protein
MRSLVVCFLCEQNMADLGDLCGQCKLRVHKMQLQIDSELGPPGLTPVRTWAKQRIAELKAQNTAGVK